MRRRTFLRSGTKKTVPLFRGTKKTVPLFRFGLWLVALVMICGLAGAEGVPGLRMEKESAAVGEVVDAEVTAEGAVAAVYTLRRGGEAIFATEEDPHLRVSYRPRQEGTYTLEAEIRFEDGHTEQHSAVTEVAGRTVEALGPETIFSQKDGWWKDKAYSRTELDNAGCAIFTLSHALQRMGETGEDVRPENLAETFRNCYVKNGTAVARLINNASKVYGYTTERNLIHDKARLREGLQNGDFYSFSIATGHIALMAGIDPETGKVRVVDSAPGATFERIRKATIYTLKDGVYAEVTDPGEIAGARYYPETGEWGGLSYYLDLEYCARRGGRQIRPAWLTWNGTEGKAAAQMVWPGTGRCVISVENEERTVATRELSWGRDGTPRLAFVPGKKSIRMLDASGKRIGNIPRRSLAPVLAEEADRIQVMYDEKRGWVSREDVEILEAAEGAVPTGILSVNGVASGRTTVRMRLGPSEKESIAANWKTGTEVALFGSEEEFLLAEAMGMRLWVHRDFVTPAEGTELPGSASGEAGSEPADAENGTGAASDEAAGDAPADEDGAAGDEPADENSTPEEDHSEGD